MSMMLMVRVMKMEIGSPTRKLVLLKLADNANDDGVCWPSYQNIADHCEMDRRTAMRHIAKLSELGFIKITYRKHSKQNNKTNLFLLTLDRPSGDNLTLSQKALLDNCNLEHAPSEDEKPNRGSDNLTLPPSDKMTLGSVTADTRVVSQDHQGVVSPLSPRTSHSFEPVKEPVIRERGPLTRTFIPDDFQPSEVILFDLKRNGLKPLDKNELQIFIDHYQGEGVAKVDWDKVYRKWVVVQRTVYDKQGSKHSKRPDNTVRPLATKKHIPTDDDEKLNQERLNQFAKAATANKS